MTQAVLPPCEVNLRLKENILFSCKKQSLKRAILAMEVGPLP
jgi:hypothetical protein